MRMQTAIHACGDDVIRQRKHQPHVEQRVATTKTTTTMTTMTMTKRTRGMRTTNRTRFREREGTKEHAFCMRAMETRIVQEWRKGRGRSEGDGVKVQMVEISGNKAKAGKREREIETKGKRTPIPRGGRKVFSFLFFLRRWGERHGR